MNTIIFLFNYLIYCLLVTKITHLFNKLDCMLMKIFIFLYNYNYFVGNY